jgi:hypothetical protein
MAAWDSLQVTLRGKSLVLEPLVVVQTVTPLGSAELDKSADGGFLRFLTCVLKVCV